ncbi:MAG TPA: 50S ribosomal protein L24 [Bacillota bacterium]|nr:50S ribosomal protein L24 [Bacillota bacterium]
MGVNVNIKKGDEVLIISGKDKGRRGKVQRVFPSENAVIVEGLNLAKKHSKPSKANPQGGVIDKALPLNISKVMVVCPGCNKPTRIVRERAADGTLVRSCRHCNRNLE